MAPSPDRVSTASTWGQHRVGKGVSPGVGMGVNTGSGPGIAWDRHLVDEVGEEDVQPDAAQFGF